MSWLTARTGATIGLLLAVFVVALDGTVTATALPRIAAELGGLDYYVWVTTAYLVTSTVVQPIAGKLGDLFGRRRVVLGGLAGFIVASVLVGQSAAMAELVALRAVQGLFGGVLFAVPFAAVADLYPVEQRVKTQGLFGAVGGIAAIVGPLVGGAITDRFGWRWIFYLNVPVGLVGLILIRLFLAPSEHHGRWRELDLLGSAALIAAVVPLLVGLSLGGSSGWTPTALALIVAGMGMGAVFIALEWRAPLPLVPPSLFSSRLFSLAIVIAAFSGIGLYGVTFFLALLYQAVLGTNAMGSGTLLVPMMLAMAVAAPISGQFLVRIRQYRFVATTGLAAMAIAAVLLGQTGPTTASATVTAETVLFGFGMGLTWPISTAVIQAAMPMEVMGVATSQVNFWRSLGGTAGAVAIGVIFARQLPGAIGERLGTLQLPAPVAAVFSGSGRNAKDASALLDSARLAQLRHGLAPAVRPALDQAAAAVRAGFGTVLGEVFVLTGILLLVPIAASVLLPEVRLRGTSRLTAGVPVARPAEAIDR